MGEKGAETAEDDQFSALFKRTDAKMMSADNLSMGEDHFIQLILNKARVLFASNLFSHLDTFSLPFTDEEESFVRKWDGG